jgi:hypothetical protein
MTMTALDRAARVVQRAIGPRLKTRMIPMISFEFDPSVEGAIRVSELIREARATDADSARGGSGEAPDAGGEAAGQDGGGSLDREDDGNGHEPER